MKKIIIKNINTPIGEMIAGSTDNGLCLLIFYDNKKELSKFKKKYDVEYIDGSNIHIEKLQKQLLEYFNNQRQEFNLSLDLWGTDFEKKIWQALRGIGYGSTLSYLEQAKIINNQFFNIYIHV